MRVVTFHLTLRTYESFGEQVEAKFQIEAPDPYPPNKQRTDLGTLVVLSDTRICYINTKIWACLLLTLPKASDRGSL